MSDQVTLVIGGESDAAQAAIRGATGTLDQMTHAAAATATAMDSLARHVEQSTAAQVDAMSAAAAAYESMSRRVEQMGVEQSEAMAAAAKQTAVLHRQVEGLTRSEHTAAAAAVQMGTAHRELEQHAHRAGGAIGSLNDRLSVWRRGGEVVGEVDALGSSLLRVSGAATLAGGAIAAMYVRSSVELGAQRVLNETAMSAIMGDAQAAAGHILRLREIARAPGVDLAGGIALSQGLQAVDIPDRWAERGARGTGNALALSGKPAAFMSNVGIQFQQIVAKGALQGDDLRELTTTLPQVRAILMRSQYHTADPEKLAAMGVGGGAALRTIIEGLEKLPKAPNTWANSVENAGIAWREGQIEFAKGLFGGGTQAELERFNKHLEELAPRLHRVGEELRPVLEGGLKLTRWVTSDDPFAKLARTAGLALTVLVPLGGAVLKTAAAYETLRIARLMASEGAAAAAAREVGANVVGGVAGSLAGQAAAGAVSGTGSAAAAGAAGGATASFFARTAQLAGAAPAAEAATAGAAGAATGLTLGSAAAAVGVAALALSPLVVGWYQVAAATAEAKRKQEEYQQSLADAIAKGEMTPASLDREQKRFVPSTADNLAGAVAEQGWGSRIVTWGASGALAGSLLPGPLALFAPLLTGLGLRAAGAYGRDVNGRLEANELIRKPTTLETTKGYEAAVDKAQSLVDLAELRGKSESDIVDALHRQQQAQDELYAAQERNLRKRIEDADRDGNKELGDQERAALDALKAREELDREARPRREKEITDRPLTRRIEEESAALQLARARLGYAKQFATTEREVTAALERQRELQEGLWRDRLWKATPADIRAKLTRGDQVSEFDWDKVPAADKTRYRVESLAVEQERLAAGAEQESYRRQREALEHQNRLALEQSALGRETAAGNWARAQGPQSWDQQAQQYQRELQTQERVWALRLQGAAREAAYQRDANILGRERNEQEKERYEWGLRYWEMQRREARAAADAAVMVADAQVRYTEAQRALTEQAGGMTTARLLEEQAKRRSQVEEQLARRSDQVRLAASEELSTVKAAAMIEADRLAKTTRRVELSKQELDEWQRFTERSLATRKATIGAAAQAAEEELRTAPWDRTPAQLAADESYLRQARLNARQQDWRIAQDTAGRAPAHLRPDLLLTGQMAWRRSELAQQREDQERAKALLGTQVELYQGRLTAIDQALQMAQTQRATEAEINALLDRRSATQAALTGLVLQQAAIQAHERRDPLVYQVAAERQQAEAAQQAFRRSEDLRQRRAQWFDLGLTQAEIGVERARGGSYGSLAQQQAAVNQAAAVQEHWQLARARENAPRDPAGAAREVEAVRQQQQQRALQQASDRTQAAEQLVQRQRLTAATQEQVDAAERLAIAAQRQQAATLAANGQILQSEELKVRALERERNLRESQFDLAVRWQDAFIQRAENTGIDPTPYRLQKAEALWASGADKMANSPAYSDKYLSDKYLEGFREQTEGIIERRRALDRQQELTRPTVAAGVAARDAGQSASLASRVLIGGDVGLIGDILATGRLLSGQRGGGPFEALTRALAKPDTSGLAREIGAAVREHDRSLVSTIARAIRGLA